MNNIILASGGFDPLHRGHLNLLDEASELGGLLMVLVNNDKWLKAKKGFHLMPEGDRMEVINRLPNVDSVVLTHHNERRLKEGDMSIVDELRFIEPDIFVNGGDRKEDNIPEYQVCEELGIEMVFGVGGGKEASSSEMFNSALADVVDNYRDNLDNLVEDFGHA